MIEIFEQLGLGIVVLLGIGYGILKFAHYLTFPISEEKMRQIIREEVEKVCTKSYCAEDVE